MLVDHNVHMVAAHRTVAFVGWKQAFHLRTSCVVGEVPFRLVAQYLENLEDILRDFVQPFYYVVAEVLVRLFQAQLGYCWVA